MTPARIALIVAAFALVASARVATPKSGDDDSFLQFDAQLGFFANQKPFGDGVVLPFTTVPGYAGQVQQIVHDRRLSYFFIMWNPIGDQLAPSPSCVAATAGVELWGTDASQPLSFTKITTTPHNSRLLVDTSVTSCFNGEETCIYVVSPRAVLFGRTVGVPTFANPIVFRTTPIALFPDQSQIRDVAMQFNVEAAMGDRRASLMIATDSGLNRYFHMLEQLPMQRVTLSNMNGTWLNTSDVRQVFCFGESVNVNNTRFMGGQCFASTAEHFQTSNAWTSDLVHRIAGDVAQYHYKTPGIIDARPTAMAYDATWDAVIMVNQKCMNVFFANGTLYRVEGFHGKLPQTNLTAVAATRSGNAIWIGSVSGGAMRLQHDPAPTGALPTAFRDDSPWRYFFGPRWLPGRGFTDGMSVTAIAVAEASTLTPETTLVATDGGISFIYFRNMTLREKAARFQAIVYPRHDRFGLCADVSLTEFGNVSSYVKHPRANDGLWTSLYVASQSFRYAATNSTEAKQNAWHSFYGMRLLLNATGVPGYMGRSVQALVNGACPDTSSQWHISPTMPGFCFYGTTSSDEVTGHLHVYPIFHDLVAETSEEKELVRGTIYNITSHIVDNNFTLVGYEGHPTQWGHWDPASLNDDQFWYDERGVNAMQILSYLSSAYRLTGAQKFADAFNYLVDVHGYAENLVNAKVTQPSDVNYSDDELTFLPYFAFIWSGRPSDVMQTNPLFEKIKDKVLLSIERTFQYVRAEKPDLWGLMYLAFIEGVASLPTSSPQLRAWATAKLSERRAAVIKDAMFSLTTQPLSWVDWPVNNAARLDVIANPHVNRNGQPHMLIENLLPYDEITLMRWNGNPHETRMGSGFSETDPSAWLYPYWLGRYFGFLN